MPRPPPHASGASGAPAGGENQKPFGSRPLASLARLAGDLPSLPAEAKSAGAAEPAEPDARFGKLLAGRIVIHRDARGRGGKTVTIARGLAGPETLLEALAKELRHELGLGVRVDEGALVVQGAQSERLAASLARRGARRVVLGN